MILDQKIALVTGGAKGIGRSISLALAQNGCDLIVHYNRSTEHANSLRDQVENFGRKIWLVQADFSEMEAITSFFPDQIEPILTEESRELDLLVNNAGIYAFNTHWQVKDDVFDRFFTINVKAPLHLMKDAYRFIREGGKVVNISSTTAKTPSEKMVIYGASKAALENVTQSFVKVYRKKNISVNIIAPGLIDTTEDENDTVSKVIKQYMLRKAPDSRLGTPEDVAKVIVFLASGMSDWVNAQRIEVTGGISF